MSDVVGAVFEVGESSGGATTMATWIAAQVTGSLASNVVASAMYEDGEESYLLVLMSTILTQYPTAVAAGPVHGATFDVRNGLKGLLAWMNLYVTGLTAPAAPTLSLISAGALTSQGTQYVKITLVGPSGVSIASAEHNIAVTDNHELVVASPVQDASGLATGWNVYIGQTSGSEKLQNVSPIAIGTNYTQTLAFTTSGVVAPVANTSGMKYIQSFKVASRLNNSHQVTVILSR